MLGNQKKKKNQLNSYARYSSLATQMAVIIIAGAFLGDFLDSKTKGDTPIYTIIFSLLSIFLALYYAIRGIIRDNEKK
jgi:F0F1-type ATP synthase assembly protein I